MFDLEVWLADYVRVMRSAFGGRVRFIGIQGSRARGEAAEGSDIDVVLILDRLDFDDMRRYREAAEALPHRELLCGFVSGADELRDWDRGELFGFYHDTRPVLGRLEELIPVPGAGLLAALLKTSRFVLRARCFCETGRYFSSLDELAERLTGADRAVLELSRGGADFEAASRLLYDWARGLIEEYAM